jgi:hypothetical protein
MWIGYDGQSRQQADRWMVGEGPRTLERVDGHVVSLSVELLGPHERVLLPLEVRQDQVHQLEHGLQACPIRCTQGSL